MEKEESGGGEGETPSIVSPSFVASVAGLKGRQRFTIELRPGKTTCVSWKELIMDANKANPMPPPVLEAPPTGAHPALEARIAPGQPTDCELKDEPPSNRFSAVIEKIERLYMGKQSSDEEELDDVPDDDQYDTEDSFIDDAELDQYFQVDKSTTKHNGFFINKGKLERTNELVSSPNHQPKKRKKDTTKDFGEKDTEHVPIKQAKLGNVRMKAAARTAPFVSSKVSTPSHNLATVSDNFKEGKSQKQLHALVGPVRNKPTDSKSNLEHSSSPKLQVRDDSGFVEAKGTDKLQSRDSGNIKVASHPSEATHQRYRDSSVAIQHELQSCKNLTSTTELEPAAKHRQRGKNGSSMPVEYPIRTVKNEKSTSMHVKEGSSVRSKGTMLERAIRELEIIVSESRPQTIEIHDADTSSQGIKRRLPRAVKQKLAKVARLAQSSQGKISEELIHRLMSILGHIVQLKTLKRNLKAMVESGLSAKQEKDDMFQKIKKEVIEMIKTQAASSKNKTGDQRDGTFDDFQELVDSEEKGHLKGNFSMDNAMEDKICDLYDLYVEGIDEDKGPQIRKLYVELAELWPNGLMDNHGIKNAVCRAKERKRAHYARLKEKETVKRRKLPSASRTEEIGSGEANYVAQPRVLVERIASDNNRGLLSPNKTATNLIASTQQSSERLPNSTVDWLKQEKMKHSSSTFLEKARKTLDGVPIKKKVKRKPESDSGDMKYPPEKLSLQQAKERQKSKQPTNFPQKSSLQSVFKVPSNPSDMIS